MDGNIQGSYSAVLKKQGTQSTGPSTGRIQKRRKKSYLKADNKYKYLTYPGYETMGKLESVLIKGIIAKLRFFF